MLLKVNQKFYIILNVNSNKIHNHEMDLNFIKGIIFN